MTHPGPGPQATNSHLLISTNNPNLIRIGLTIQRHVDPDVSFSHGWVDYEAGFGDLDGDFWIGLAEMHRLTAFCPAIIGINMTADDGESAWVSTCA